MSRLIKGKNDLKTINPHLAEEWNYDRNGDLTPESVACNSDKKAWWKCPSCGYEWEANISNRSKGNGCPACANKVVIPGRNDLATIPPSIAMDWDYEKNDDLLPSAVTPGRKKSMVEM